LSSMWTYYPSDVARFHSANRSWTVYQCSSCRLLVLACCHAVIETEIMPLAWYPSSQTVAEEIPERARAFLRQAMESLGQAAGAVMLSASAIDAMLKVKGYKDESLYVRIDKAAADHVITSDMAKWAHQVRLDANDQRHADEAASLPTPEDAKRCLDFALALAEVMFVLPSRVTRGIQETQK